MKKLYIILIVSLFYLLIGCDEDKVLYDGPRYLIFDAEKSSYILKDEDKDTIDIKLGLTVPLKENLTINISVLQDSTLNAVESYDFEILDKVVTIPAGEYFTTVKIKALVNNLTPVPVRLKLRYENIPENLISSSYGNTVSLTFSKFFEITPEWLEGDWKMTDYDIDTGEQDADSYTITISHLANDTIAIHNIFEGNRTILATMDYSTGIFTFLPLQIIGFSSTYGNVYMIWCNGINYSPSGEKLITGVCNFYGIKINEWGAFIEDSSPGRAYGVFNSTLEKIE